MAQVVSLEALIDSVGERAASADVLDQLATAAVTAAELGELGDALLGYYVDRCRHDGRSWAEIGGSLGVTKQAVQKRFVERGTLPFTLERFTDRARRVQHHATTAARHLRHNYRGTEHLLLGLFDEPDGVAAHVLAELGITRSAMESATLAVTPRGTTIPTGDLPLTPRAVRVLELAGSSEAPDLGHVYVGTEHILLAIMREHDGLAAQFLRARNLDHDTIKTRTVALLAGYTE